MVSPLRRVSFPTLTNQPNSSAAFFVSIQCIRIALVKVFFSNRRLRNSESDGFSIRWHRCRIALELTLPA
uniref:Uncharacterized protein n=1 Tax=Daphnia magna TaxID=35525 RepID=A0A0P5CAN9_9CRUS